MLNKNNKLINISELAIQLGLVSKKNKKPLTHTLRFWETKFKQLKPTILAGGRRYYSTKDIKVVKIIFYLLKEQGMTINGAKNEMNKSLKDLDDTRTSSVKATYHKDNIKKKSKILLDIIKKLNGKKNSY
jgi:DNA-binding transcriptional MerR regulator|tara:strand:+ start:70 stop:459 length:390 start_codon:yes stop_codon:yes gene_type:complete